VIWSRLPLTGLLCLILVGFPVYAQSEEESSWLSASSGLMTVRYHTGHEHLAEQVLERADKYLMKASNFLGLEAEGRYLIVIARSKEEFTRLQPSSYAAPEWAGALTYPELDLVLIMSPGSMGLGGGSYWFLVQHEIVHLLLGDAELESGTRLPRWFQEGIATYVSGEMSLARLLRLGWAQVTGAVPSFEQLEVHFPEQADLAEVAYARSFLFIRYLTRRFGNGAVAGLVRESLKLGGVDEGARAAFGIPLEEILEGFRQYSRVKATWIPALGSAASIWAGITLLFLLTWYRKRILGLRTLRRWELEEKWIHEDQEQKDVKGRTLH
jgi:hypothetical protein